MEAGIRGYMEKTVTEEMTARAFKSGLDPVFATPCLVALAEETCMNSVANQLSEGEGTVGTQITMSHVAATPVGMKVHCESVLTAVDRRKLTFSVQAFDEAGLIGEGTHERFIINREKFVARAQAKLQPSA